MTFDSTFVVVLYRACAIFFITDLITELMISFADGQ